MSLQKGNTARSRPQKYKNRTVFRNNMHDKSNKIKLINNIQVGDVCVRCKDIIEWKIKYKKYKPLSQPRTCTKCSQKSVKKAYHVICSECVKTLQICAKCLQSKEIVPGPVEPQEQIKLDVEMKYLLKTLPERKRRTFDRYMKSERNGASETSTDDQKDALLEKLKQLHIQFGRNDDDENDSFGSDIDDHDDCNSDYDKDEDGNEDDKK